MALDRSAVITVDRIASLIAEVAACQKPYVDRICTGCPDPCCRRVHYLFTKIDLLFIQLAGKKRRWRSETFLSTGCWFLGSDGCTLDPECRPMICHRYICPDLEGEMMRQDARLLPALKEKFKQIRNLQHRLMAACSK